METQELRSQPQPGKRGVLRAYALIVAVEVALIALLRAAHVSWGVVNALAILACIVVLFGSQLTGPPEHVQISSPAFEQRIQERYSSESSQLSKLGFTPLFFFGEAFPLIRLLLIYPAFVVLIMWLNREVLAIQNGSRLLFGFPVFNSPDGTTYAHPLQLGVKFHTRFEDGAILMTKSFGGKRKYGPAVVVHALRNASISDTWAEHRKQIQTLEVAGKQVDGQISFETYSNISRTA